MARATNSGGKLWINRDQIMPVLTEAWGNDHDAGMHLMSLQRRGYLLYWEDGDYTIEVEVQHAE